MKKKVNQNQSKMNRLRRFLAWPLILFFCIASEAIAQNATKQIDNFNVSVTHATLIGKTRPVSELKRVPATSKEKKDKSKRQKMVPNNFNGRNISKVKYPEKEHQGVDPLWQRGMRRSMSRTAESLVNVDGLSNSFGSPHDPTGVIGHTYYVQAINATTIGEYDKEGNLLDSFSANTLWTELGVSSLGDPIIMYDQEVKRWVITEFANPAELLIGVSDTEDPLGTYNVYRYTTPNFPDYPKYGIWSNAYVVSTNEQGPGFLHQYFIDRNSMLNGDDNVTIQRIEITGNSNTEAGFYVTTPADWAGDTAPADDLPIVMRLNDSSWGDIADDAIELYQFDIDWNNASNTQITTTTITTTPFDSNPCAAEVPGTFACIPQLDGQGIDGIPEVIMNVPQYRNFGSYEAIVLSFITDVTDGDNLAGIRWVELRREGSGNWELYQEGTFAPEDGLHRFMSSIAMDGNGNIGLSYNVSSPETYAGIRFTGRLASDPLGEMTFNEVNIVDGTNPINTFRFGDYAHMSVDPSDERTFWYTSEYAGNGSDNSLTRIHAFQLARDTTDIGPIAIVSPASGSGLSNSESVTVEVRNFGLDSVETFELGLIYNGAVLETFNYNDKLKSDSIFTHTFTSTIDMSELGEYAITVYTTMDGDDNPNNDTLVAKINHYANLDMAITSVSVPEFTCENSTIAEIEIKNKGVTTVTEASIEISLNGNIVETLNWTGSLDLNQKETVEVSIGSLELGLNTIQAVISGPNGGTDEVSDNDLDSAQIDYSDNLEEFTIRILTDNYPEEITWSVFDNDTDVVVASGGPYTATGTLYETSFCVSPVGCYTFEILDSAGDGICCGFGEGYYEISNGSGTVIASGGDYNSSDTQSICSSDLALVEFVALESASSFTVAEEITIKVRNVGSTLISNIDVSLSLNNSEISTGVIAELDGGATIDYTFPITVDMSADGDYSFEAALSATDDLNASNNEISKLITNHIGLDVSADISIPSSICNSPYEFNVVIVNHGFDMIASLDVVFELDGEDIETLNWVGSLYSFDRELVSKTIELTEGEHVIGVRLENPNGSTDEVPENNEDSKTILFDASFNDVTLEITPDDYPDEITWQITQQGQAEVLFSGGPYEGSATLIESICLDPTLCYTLTMFDSYGDGICCAEGNGSYQLVSSDGEVLISSDGNYGNQESNDFCPELCALTADIEITHATSINNNGTIVITASGGIEPYEYSIDGGASFQSSNIFDGLASGSYEVVVDENGNCRYEETVVVDMITNADGWIDGSLIQISPNPSNGVFQLNVTNPSIKEFFITVQVLDLNGRLIQERRIGKYDEKFTGTISLYDYPEGVYFLRFVSKDIQTISRVLKQD